MLQHTHTHTHTHTKYTNTSTDASHSTKAQHVRAHKTNMPGKQKHTQTHTYTTTNTHTPPAVDLPVIARHSQQRRRQLVDVVGQQVRLIRSGKGPAHVSRGITHVSTYAVRPSAHVVQQSCLDGGHLRVHNVLVCVSVCMSVCVCVSACVCV